MNSSNSSSSSGSSPPNQYANIISTVSELRADLEKAMLRMKSLEEQNQSLTKSYETTKDELIETKRKYHEIRENYANTVSEKTEAERRNDAFIDRIKMQLAEKTREFELHREKLKPQDVDSIRIKVQEELEIPHRLRIQSITAECESHKDMFYAMKRELEKAKVEFDIICSNNIREIDALRSEREADSTLLRSKLIEIHEKRFSKPENDDTLRANALHIQELTRAIENLKDEVHNLRHQRDNISSSLEEMKSKYEKILLDCKLKLKQSESFVLEIEGRYNFLTTSMELKDQTINILRQSIEDVSFKADALERSNETFAIRMSAQTENFVKEMEECKASRDRDVISLHKDIDALTLKLIDREENIHKVQRSSSEMQQRSESNIAEMKQCHWKQMQELNKRYLAVEVEYTNSTEDYEVLQIQSKTKLEQCIAEMEITKSEVSRLKREKEVIYDKLRDCNMKVEVDKQKLTDQISLLKGKITSLEKQLKDFRQHEIVMVDELKAAKDVEVTVLASLAKGAHNNELAEADRKAFIEAVRVEFGRRFDRVHDSYKNKISKIRSKHIEELDRERKRSAAYKDKALIAFQRLKVLSSGLTEE